MEDLDMELKKATKEDVAAIAALEARCFPKLEAATEASVRTGLRSTRIISALI